MTDIFPGGAVVKNLPANAGDTRDMGSIPGSGRSSEVRNGNTLIFLPGKHHGQRKLAGYSLWDCKESDTTGHTHTHTQYLIPYLFIITY